MNSPEYNALATEGIWAFADATARGRSSRRCGVPSGAAQVASVAASLPGSMQRHDFAWGFVRVERVRCATIGRPQARDGVVEWTFVVERLERLVARDVRAMAGMQQMFETFVRASFGRQTLVQIVKPGATAALKLRAKQSYSGAASEIVSQDVIRFMPIWAGFIEQCLQEGSLCDAATANT